MGEIPISGAKNAALKLMAAALLTEEPLLLANVPRLADVGVMAELLRSLGVEVEIARGTALGGGDQVRLEAARIASAVAPYESCARCARVFRFWVRSSRAKARRGFRCRAAARSGQGRSISI